MKQSRNKLRWRGIISVLLAIIIISGIPFTSFAAPEEDAITVTPHSYDPSTGNYTAGAPINVNKLYNNNYEILASLLDSQIQYRDTINPEELRFIGWSAKQPSQMPVYTTDEFGLVDRNATNVEIGNELERLSYRKDGSGSDPLYYDPYYYMINKNIVVDGNIDIYSLYQTVSYDVQDSYWDEYNTLDFNGGNPDYYSGFSDSTNASADYGIMVGSGTIEPIFENGKWEYMEEAGSPALVLRESLSTTTEGTTVEPGELYGNKTAQWTDYEQLIGNIQFDFMIQPEVQDTDVVVVLNKSAWAEETEWEASVDSVNDIAGELLANGNSANNRVALVQFGGNTLNSFNFQSDEGAFDTNFANGLDYNADGSLKTPVSPLAYRNGDGEVVHTYPEGTVNPAGYYTSDYTLALEQAELFAESRNQEDSERPLTIVFVSHDDTEVYVGHRDMYYRVLQTPNFWGDEVSPGNQINAISYTRELTFDMHGDGVDQAETELYHRMFIGTTSQYHDGIGATSYGEGYQYTNLLEEANGISKAAELKREFGAAINFIGVNLHGRVGYTKGNDIVIEGWLKELGTTEADFSNVADVSGDKLNSALQKVFYSGSEPLPTEALESTYSDAILSDIITEDYRILVDNTHPITLERGGVEITLTESPDNTPEVNQYYIETISYAGGEREQIKVNIGEIDRNLVQLNFYIEVTDPNLADGNYPTNEEHLLTYTDTPPTGEERVVERNDLGDPSLEVATVVDPIPTPDPTPTPGPTPVIPAVTPVPVAVVPVATLPAIPTPLAEVPTNIDETEVPLASGSAWSLLDLILTVVTGIMTIMLLVTYFTGRKEEEEYGEIKKKGLLRLISLIPALGAILLFFLTQDMTQPMIIVDEWTIYFAIIAIVQGTVTFFSRKKVEEDENFDATA